jgi:hypothetical protein
MTVLPSEALSRERPRRRAAEQRDELAPFHLIKLHPLPQPGESTTAPVTKQSL